MQEKASSKLTAKLMGLVVAAGVWIITTSIPSASAKGGAAAASVNVREEFDLATPGTAVAVAWSADGSALAAASDFGGVLTVWDRNGHLINQFKRIGGGPTLGGSIAFVAGSSQLVFPPPENTDSSMAFAVWDVKTGEIIRTESGPQLGDERVLNRAQHFMASPDEGLLAVATTGGRGNPQFKKNLIVYDTHSWQVLQTTKVLPGISSLCVFANGRLLGVGSILGGRISVIDMSTGAAVSELQAYEESKYGSVSLGAIAGSPAGDLIMAGVSSGLLHGDFRGTPEQRAWDEAMSSTDAVRIFRTKDGMRLATFSAAKGPIRQAMWDPKGHFVAFVDNQRGLFLWAPWIGPDYKKIDLPSKTLSLAISPHGDHIAVTTDRGVRVYSLH
jgi:WD40 repeat protein